MDSPYDLFARVRIFGTSMPFNVTGNSSEFPVIEKYFDHVHTIQEQPVTIHKKLDKVLVENLNEVLAMYNRGIKLTFTGIKAIRNIMEEELGK